MAKNQQTTSSKTQTFTKGLVKDYSDSYVPDNSWTHAVNAINATQEGDFGTLSNEESNYLCASVKPGYLIIGKIYLDKGNWVIFSTNETDSEIGWFSEEACRYCPIVNDPCLNFSKLNLITGKSRTNFDCTTQIYWADGKNPDRAMNIGDTDYWQCIPDDLQDQTPWPGVPYLQKCTEVPEPDNGDNCVVGNEVCVICENIQPLQLDCEKIRLARIIKTPCLNISKGPEGGNMPNGSYYVVVAYSINQQRVTDYFTPSNVQPIFAHNNLAGSLQINIQDMDTEHFDEFELVIVSIINQQTVAKQVGFYSTTTGIISLDSIDLTTPTIPLEFIPLTTPVYEKSNQISSVNNYLLRLGPTTKFDFNYQPLANRIETNWVAVEYAPDYYRKGGNRTSYLRDEVYAFWIRWIYETGDRSPSYHIPGRPPKETLDEVDCIPTDKPYGDLDLFTGNDAIELQYPTPNNCTPSFFEVYNTAYLTQLTNEPLTDGGTIVARGRMGYWQSSEKYPNKPQVWNTSEHPWSSAPCITDTAYGEANIDLCSRYIRHHKMPDNKCVPHIKSYPAKKSSEFYSDVEKIVILGVEFNNIRYPVDNEGNGIPGIVGYEILRGTREGNRSIIAKGMFNHMRGYDMPKEESSLTGTLGLYQNYPYNCLLPDPFLTTKEPTLGDECETPPAPIPPPLDKVSSNIFTFHSPDTQFREPFLAEKEVKIYGEIFGDVVGAFDEVPGHPKEKLITDFSLIIAAFAGIGLAALSILGNRTMKRTSGYAFNLGNTDYGQLTQGLSIGTIQAATGSAPPSTTTYTQTSPGNQNYGGKTLTPEDNGTSQEQLTTDNQDDTNQVVNTEEPNILKNPQTDGGAVAIANFLNNPSQIYTGVSSDYASNVKTKKGYVGPGYEIDLTLTPFGATRGLLGKFGLSEVANFLYYWSQGADSVIKLIEAWIPYVQYALMYKSHCKYTQFDKGYFCQPNNQRKLINQLFYLDNNVQSFSTTPQPVVPPLPPASIQAIVNNLYRNKCVLIELNSDILSVNDFTVESRSMQGSCLYQPTGLGQIYRDNTLQTLKSLSDPNGSYYDVNTTFGQNANWYLNPTKQFRTHALSLYGAIKYRNRNQYGQLELVRQIPITDCTIKLNLVPTGTQLNFENLCRYPFKYDTGLLYGGDTYIGRYTEKNKFFYFYDWLYDLPDGTPLDYTLKTMIFYPRYWADFTGFDLGEFISNIFSLNFLWNALGNTTRMIPNDFHALDKECSGLPFNIGSISQAASIFNVNNAYFYLFNTGVRDFFVESEINIDLRDWDDLPEQRFYDPYAYTNLNALFDPRIIKEDNYYKYDYSLSVSRIYNNFISWGNMQQRYYDPTIAERCYQYYPNRIIYSLPNQQATVKDYWYSFLANNYRDFSSEPNSVYGINKNGALITFETEGPIMFQGVDTLETELSTKITIGDGGLFSQPLQTVVNADVAFEYGSCQDKFSVISTPAGIFYISQNQGKIFEFTGNGIGEISAQNMRWWFSLYLPYKILDDYPDYGVVDNPVAGVGCQTIYDNIYEVVYFCKKDYKLKPEYKDQLVLRDDKYTFNLVGAPTQIILLGDERFFDDASWTVSYDPGEKAWISFHDWHPDMVIPSKKDFLTTKDNGIWRHNDLTDSFCNFYGVDYKFEIDIAIPTGQQVNTIRNFEYILECYIYDQQGIDKYNVLDFNFNQAVVYNIEQTSGLLILNPTPKNDIAGRLLYPIVNPTDIQILYAKEENKYRFNQFWDITDDRGEFFNPTIPGFAQRPIWETAPNGYVRTLNPANLNYSKSPLQRKKFRHYVNNLNLYRYNSTADERKVKMIMKISNTKNLYSPR